MAAGLSREVVRNLTTLCTAGVFGNLSDEQLLDRFIELSGDVAEAAFATLVQRHGAMVLGVCHRILRDSHAAEDAFQATFLVLARKATSVVPRDRVANWLYGVAYRTANESRVRAARRLAREAKVARRPLDQSPGESSHPDLREILDDELAALPSRYRGPLVLCELEGLSRQDAARRLAIREGTLSSRLARGKARLRERLARRGFEPPGGAVPFVLIREATATMLNDRLIDSTARAAMRVAAGVSTAAVVSTSVVSLTEGVLKSMLLSKIKGIALIVGSSVAVVSGAVALGQTGPGPQATRPADADRMTVMERKLDRIIDALDRMTGSMPVSSTVTKPAAPFERLADAVDDDRRKEPVPKVGASQPALDVVRQERWRKPATGLQPPGLAERVESVERDLHAVQRLLEQLDGRVKDLERAALGASDRRSDGGAGIHPPTAKP